MDSSDMPLLADIFSAIAGHLAGDHAFGALAQLNQINHLVHEATLPVLYDTLLMDNVRQLPYYRPGFRYTRFLIQSDGEEEMFSNMEETFPQLFAEITISGRTNEIHLYIYQPVTTATLFAIILQTPIHHQPFSHIECGVRTREEQLPHRRGGPDRYPTKQCAEMEEEPLLRTPKTMRSLQFGECGGLTAQEKQSARPWTTDVLMHGTCLRTPPLLAEYDMTAYTDEECEAIDWDEGPVPLPINLPGPPPIGWNLFAARTGNVVELLGLAERGPVPDAAFDLDSGLVRGPQERDAVSACRHRLQYRHWHLELYMDQFYFSGFFVNMKLSRLLHSDRPQYRLKILITEVVGEEQFNMAFNALCEMYLKSIPVDRFPFGRGPAHLILAVASSYGKGKPKIKATATRFVGRLYAAKVGDRYHCGHGVTVEVKERGVPTSDNDFTAF